MIKHYYHFSNQILDGKKLDQTNWEILREGADSTFAIEKTKGEWERSCKSSVFHKKLAHSIVGLSSPALTKWISFGIGKAILEWNLVNENPSIELSGTDYTKGTVLILKDYFENRLDVFWFDVMDFNSYDKLNGYEVALMNRISTEFDKSEWKKIFFNLYDTSIQEIIFIPTEILTIGIGLKEELSHISHLISGKKDTFSGYMYSRREFERLFGKWKVRQFIDDETPMWLLAK